MLLNLFVALLIDVFARNHAIDQVDETDPIHAVPVDDNEQLSLVKMLLRACRSIPPRVTHTKALVSEALARVEASSWMARSVLIFSEKNLLRLACTHVLGHPAFEMFILAIVFLSMLLITLDDPFKPSPLWLEYAEYVFSLIFVVEMCAKVISLGLFFNTPQAPHQAYLRDYTNIIEFIVVLTSVVSLQLPSDSQAGVAARSSRVGRLTRVGTRGTSSLRCPALPCNVTIVHST
jgi:hypothetical protein